MIEVARGDGFGTTKSLGRWFGPFAAKPASLNGSPKGFQKKASSET